MNALYHQLLDFAFRAPPIFRQPFDRHVRQWEEVKRRELWLLYHADGAFRAAYEREVYRRRNTPLPAWGVAA